MSNKNPFEIRLELLNLAQSIVNERVWAERNRLEHDWNELKSRTSDSQPCVPFPEMPTASEEEIVELAKTLNDFVSDSRPSPREFLTENQVRASEDL